MNHDDKRLHDTIKRNPFAKHAKCVQNDRHLSIELKIIIHLHLMAFFFFFFVIIFIEHNVFHYISIKSLAQNERKTKWNVFATLFGGSVFQNPLFYLKYSKRYIQFIIYGCYETSFLEFLSVSLRHGIWYLTTALFVCVCITFVCFTFKMIPL